MTGDLKAGNLWREALKGGTGHYSERTLSDEAERSFWKSYLLRKKEKSADAYAEDIWNAVKDILGDGIYPEVLEVGPGWGNYTLKLAKIAGRLSCVDISPDILDYVRNYLCGHGYPMQAHCVKWEDFQGEGYDLAFGFNCFYRMRRIEDALLNFHRAAKFRVIGMAAGREQDYYAELERTLGARIRYRKFDYHLLAHILKELGLDAGLRIVPLKRIYRYDDAFREAMNKIENPEEISEEEVERVLMPYFHRNADGQLVHLHDCSAGILYW